MTGAKFCDFEKMAAIFLKYWDKYLIDGVSYTLLLSAITVLGGVVFASLLALMKMSKVAPLRWAFHHLHRGDPRHTHAAAAVFLLLWIAHADTRPQ